jgi:hypothetical protein
MPKLSDKKKKKKAQKQKQKQKQIVKTNVKVNVQSSGGSGGGGTPSFIPQMFRDTSGENQRLVSLVEQIAARVPRRIYPAPLPAENLPNPYNDPTTVNAVFNAPIDLNVPEEVGGVKKSGRPKGSKNRPKIYATLVGSESENDPVTVDAVFNAPFNSNVPVTLKSAGISDDERVKRKLIREERAAAKMVKKYGGRVEFEEVEAFGSSIPSQFMSTEY